MARHQVVVEPLPSWLEHARWLGPEPFELSLRQDGDVCARARLEAAAAADVAARLRGLGVGGRQPHLEISPPLPRSRVRAARLDDARRRRDGSVGFTRRGARLDEEGRISLTPEALALALGERVAGASVVDATAGLGGNAIGFARAGCRVIAIDRDAERLALARHNAGLYGVLDRIDFRSATAQALLPSLRGDLLFVDPPWGASYDRRYVEFHALPLLEVLLDMRDGFDRTWLKLPPSFDVGTLPYRPRQVEAIFGVAAGDQRRIKFLLAEL